MNETREQIESALVGYLLMDPEKAIVLEIDAGVRATWFLDDDYATIFETSHRLFTANKICGYDAVALFHEARNLCRDEKWKRTKGELCSPGGSAIVEKAIEAAANAATANWYINCLRRLVFKTEFGKAVRKAMETFDVDPQGAIAMVQDCASKCYSDVVGKTTVNKGEICSALEHDEYMSWHMRVDPDNPDRDKDWVPGLKSPWPELTRLYLGIGKRLHIIAARPSVGKTSIAVNLVRYWADEKTNVLVNSLDMPPEDIIDRLRTEYSRVSITKKRYTPTQDNLERLKEASRWVCESTIEVSEQYYVEDYCADLAMKAKSGHCEVALVDYVQLLNSYAVDNANEYQRVSYVAEYLKRTANHFKIPIVALCQLNRKGQKDENAEPTLTDLRGSGALEQAASTVLLLHRDQDVVDMWKTNPPWWFYENEDYGRKVAGSSIDAIWAILAKNQNGPTGRLPFVVHRPYFAWKLGDVCAKPMEKEEGVGATHRVVKIYFDSFARFHRDWRHDGWEKSLDGRVCGVLINGCAVDVLISEGEDNG